MARKTMTKKRNEPSDKLLAKITIAFFKRAKTTAGIWLILTVFGIASYTTLLRREGFPSVNIPLAIIGGTYFVNDAAKVDTDVAKPLSELALTQESVSAVQTNSAANFFTVSVQYKEGTDSKAATADLESKISQAGVLPESVLVKYNVPYFGATGGDIDQLNVAISFFDTDTQSTDLAALTTKAQEAAAWLKERNIDGIKDVYIKNPFDTVIDPSSGQSVEIQKNFDRFGVRHDGETVYYPSVIIGVAAYDGSDVIKLDDAIRKALQELDAESNFAGYTGEISASFAPQIKENIGELQKVLLEGLIAVLVVGSIVIAIRASLITVISMITVLAISIGFLYVIGYSLNVITLFALILALALIVDDTIIMVEAIDAARHNHKDRLQAVKVATRKVSRAMMAATATAALSFAPLLFVGGVLGSFIRAIPITIISALIISLFVALLFIPLFARQLLLGKKQMGAKGVKEVAAGFEAKVARTVARPMMWARNSRKRLFGVGITAVMIGLLFFAGGIVIARNVVFNIFPPTKDTNGLVLSMNYPPGTSIERAQQLAADADTLASRVIGDNFEYASYYNSGTAQGATEQIQIIPYSKRDVTSQELVKQLQTTFDNEFTEASVVVGQIDVGPPSQAFITQIKADNREAAYKLATDIASFMSSTELKRPNDSTARFINVTTSNPSEYIRSKGTPIISVSSGFNADDTSTLVTLAQNAVKDEFTGEKLSTYGLADDVIQFDLGQESENQDSFKTLALAFPIMLLVMYLLLAIEFRSLLQPLLIFLAIPFSIFGIMFGLDITNNAISFFGMLGFFALVGLSIKNTILLTDFANQSRRAGAGPIDAAVAALEERFRPLFATSITAVVSLIPLAISSPFWEGLAVVLIFGLISSTFLVVTVFPYYYLGAEYLRQKISPKTFFTWMIPAIALTIIVARLTGNVVYAILVVPVLFIVLHRTLHSRYVSSNSKRG
ncbi:MAG: efflux RND transporter permease subunit [Candidatus Saccharibacteria bacterium]|nr:efflux RND transporter permease subunit [Candidatus Saccharibacteria bacterium]